MIGKALYALLTGNAAVGAEVGTRIVPLLMERAATAVPFMLYTIDNAGTQDLLNETATLIEQTVSITIFHNSYAAAETLGQKVINALDDYTGTAGGVEVLGVFYENERVSKGGFDESPDMLFNVKEIDFKVCWRRP